MNFLAFQLLREKQLFKILLSISGVGPRLALTILDTMEVKSLVDTIRMGNSRLLTKVPGIGTKTAERIVLELKNKAAIKNFITTENNSNSSTKSKVTLPTNNKLNKISPAKKSSDATKVTQPNPNKISYFDDSINALISLGYKDVDAMAAVRAVLSDDIASLPEVIKLALKELSA